MTEPTDLTAIHSQVDAALAEFLDLKAREAVTDGFPGEVVEVLRDFVFAGGKRVRPLLCVVGWYAAGGQGIRAPVVRAAASLERFHAFTLIHDDIMDNSHTRRRNPERAGVCMGVRGSRSGIPHAPAATHARRDRPGHGLDQRRLLAGERRSRRRR
ncbi:polyprenyl synthetase family protein [Streptomyces sp. NPDC001584]|uniref:polyprenyl synthetase family protein n=1 Tax=Streptomyces sp. NPDC001584 TaxID=3154521 RepID=UPI003321581F